MGFVKLPDNLTEGAWYGDNNTLSVYIRLIMEAAWKETSYKNISLKRGQVVTTLSKLAQQNELSIQQARTILRRLKSTGKITVESETKFRIITLLEYDCDFETNRQNNKQSDYQTIKLSNYQIISCPKIRATRRAKTDSTNSGKPIPRKPRRKARFSWEKIKPDEELLKTILSALEQQKKSAQWQRDKGQFIPYPATWLNGKRWEDESCAEPTKGENSSLNIAEIERLMVERAAKRNGGKLGGSAENGDDKHGDGYNTF